MTPKQIERLKNKIAGIRRTLASEKRKYGCYDDSRGLRYLPLNYYLALADYKGGLTYIRWFHKNFDDDMCFPEFLFEWTIILFKTGDHKAAEQKAFETFCSSPKLFSLFFSKRPEPGTSASLLGAIPGSELPEFAYHAGQPELADFTQWLQAFRNSEKFLARSSKFIELTDRLRTEDDAEVRGYLQSHLQQIEKWDEAL